MAAHRRRVHWGRDVYVRDVPTSVSAGQEDDGDLEARVAVKVMLLFAACVALIVVVAGLVLAVPFSSPEDRKSIQASAIVAFVVQLFGFAIMRSVPTRSFFTGWIIGIALRFVTVVGFAIVAVKMLGMPAPAALLSLVTFFFITTLVEPKLLTL